MFTFLLVVFCLTALLVTGVALTVMLGGGFLVIFGDVVIGILLIYGIIWICKKIFKD